MNKPEIPLFLLFFFSFYSNKLNNKMVIFMGIFLASYQYSLEILAVTK